MKKDSVISTWAELLEYPEHLLHDAHTADALAVDHDSQIFKDILYLPRFRSRALKLIHTYYNLYPLDTITLPNTGDVFVLLSPPHLVSSLARYCGVLAHSQRLVAEIRAVRIVKLRDYIDENLWNQLPAFTTLDLSLNIDTNDIPELISALDQCGIDCITSWIISQETCLQDWLKLGLGDHPLISNKMDQHTYNAKHIAIVRQAAKLLGDTLISTTPAEDGIDDDHTS